MSQFNQKRSRTQAAPGLYNIYNAVGNANVPNELEEEEEEKAELFEPGVFIRDLQNIINAYSGVLVTALLKVLTNAGRIICMLILPVHPTIVVRTVSKMYPIGYFQF